MYARLYRQLQLRQACLLLAVLLSALTSVGAPRNTLAAEARIAVAANFADAAKEIGARFEEASRHRALFSVGATGQLYAQITQGAPFDVFLAADQLRPRKAVAEDLAVPGSRFTYARGRLVLYSRETERVSGKNSLLDSGFHRLAVANPETAPYGAAAIEAMMALGLYDQLEPKLVQGNNIAQTFQFVATGNAELGFVALAQVNTHQGGSNWVVPAELHAPISQDAVLLKRGLDNPAAHAFLAFLKSEATGQILARYGYER